MNMRTRKKAEPKTSDDTPTLFDFINQILLKTKMFPYDKKIASGWMLTHILSHDPKLIPFVQKINLFQFSIPDEKVYQYYYDMLPRGKRYIAIPKKIDIDEDSLTEIKTKYNVSKREAILILGGLKRCEERHFIEIQQEKK